MVPAIFVALLAAAPAPPEEAVDAWVAQERYDLALAALDAMLYPRESESLGTNRRVRLQMLRARCLFELGDYPSCEQQIRALLDGPVVPGSPEHVECLAQLGKALTLQDIHDEALKVFRRALRLHDAPALHRLAITACLRGCRFDEIFPHAAAILAADPRDAHAHFVRGIALSETGQLEEALRELSWGMQVPGAKRDAGFHMAVVLGRLRQPERALEHLLEIVAEDPYDSEACYQATQQLTRIRTPESMEAARHLRLYFLALQKAQGESSREYPFQAAGRASLAAMMRAAKWRRLQLYDRAISEIRRAEAVARDDPGPFVYEAEFWASVGLLAEAESVVSRLEERPRRASEGLDAKLRELRASLETSMERLRAEVRDAVGKARLEVARASWQDARSPLEALLSRAVAAGSLSVGDHAARLLLARDPNSIWALVFLAERTSDPSLLAPQLHYLTRLVPLLPDEKRFRDRLLEARTAFLGKSVTSSADTTGSSIPAKP